MMASSIAMVPFIFAGVGCEGLDDREGYANLELRYRFLLPLESFVRYYVTMVRNRPCTEFSRLSCLR